LVSSGCRIRQWLGGIAVAVLAVAGSGVAQADEELNWGLEKGTLVEIRFLGNLSFEDDALKKVLGLDELIWIDFFRVFHNPVYTQDQLLQGIEAVRGFYRRQGFHDVQVRLQQTEKRGSDDVVTIAVVEGPRTLVDEVHIEGAEPLDPNYLRSRLEFQSGDPAPYRALDVGRDTYRILDEYVSRGYLAARVEERIEPHDSLVTLRYHIHPGPEFRVGEIRIEGNTSTHRRHIEREMTIRVGQPFDARKITVSESKLLSTGWFRNVSLEPAELDTTSAQAVLLVNVVEGKTQFIEAGVGVGDPERWRGTAAIGERNLWGTGRAVTLRGLVLGVWGPKPLTTGENDLFWDFQAELSFFSPRFLTLPLRTSSQIFWRQESLPSSNVELERRGLSIGSPLRERARSRLDLALSLERIANRPIV
jgi:outer membrane protein assembly factor BamA